MGGDPLLWLAGWVVPRDGRVESDCSLPIRKEHMAVDRTCSSLGLGSGAEELDGSTGG